MENKAHVNAVSARLRDYERVLKAKEFIPLEPCNICRTVDYQCRDCLFNGDDAYSGCFNPTNDRCGDGCNTKAEQRAQFKHLLKRLDECDYEFK